MDSQSQEHAGFNLPMPMEAAGSHSGQSSTPEIDPNTKPNVAANTLSQPPLLPPFTDTTSGHKVPQKPSSAVPMTTNDDVASTADDADLIEKEWVMRAKRIVDATRDDPYKQSQELTAVKVDYMHKRYNKTIKQSE